MNPDNVIHLDGIVTGDSWTRWPIKRPGQVRFWLSVARALAGEGRDLLLCAVQPKLAEEVYLLERGLSDGRRVRINAEARQACDQVSEDRAGVIFIAEECGLDGGTPHNVHTLHRRPAAQGKCAAAGDVELDLGGGA